MAAAAKRRIWIQAMYLDVGQVATRVSAILLAASARGLDVRLQTDWFGQAANGGSFALAASFPFIRLLLPVSEKQKQKQFLFARLKEQGVAISITNPPTVVERFFPYKGRNHIKMSIVDDTVYLGGVNFGDRDFTYVDFMVKLNDTKSVQTLAKIFEQSANGQLEDQAVQLNSQTSILVDSGKTGASPILRVAISAANSATKSIWHINQFIPDGAFLQALYSASQRAVAVEAKVPAQNNFNSVFFFLHQTNKITMEAKGLLIPLQFLQGMVHAKLSIFDQRLALIGSHNLSQKGVQMGTAEVALLTSNPQLVSNLRRYYQQLTA